MNNLESLKQELILQKTLIEKNGGVVSVAGTNPSPAEITAGISSIASIDFSVTTATEEDVKQGKTFFSQDASLKTGTAILDADTINHIFMAPRYTVTSDEELYYAFPDDVTIIRQSCFEYNYNTIHISFTPYITNIEAYCFYYAKNFVFENLHEATSLSKIRTYAFANSDGNGIDFQNLPASLTTIDSYGFYNAVPAGSSITLPENLSTLGNYSFRSDTRKLMKDLTIKTTKLATFGTYTFLNLTFDCDLVIPTSVKTFSSQLCYNGGFKNITFHSGVTTIGNNCLGADSYISASEFNLEKLIFEGETPPSVGVNFIASQHIENGVKIYVPDNAVEAYKAVTNLASYVDIICPMSELE